MELWMYIVIAVVAVLIIALAIFITLKLIKNKKIKDSEIKVEQKIESSTASLATCFGGKDNIIDVKTTGSRVTVEVKDISLINKDSILKQFDQSMFMGNKIVFIIGSKSEEFRKALLDNIEK